MSPNHLSRSLVTSSGFCERKKLRSGVQGSMIIQARQDLCCEDGFGAVVQDFFFDVAPHAVHGVLLGGKPAEFGSDTAQIALDGIRL